MTGAASAQASDDVVQATAGDWLLAPEDGRPGCRVQLTNNATIGGWELRPASVCRTVRWPMAAAMAWRFDPETGGIAFSGPERETVLSFTEKEDGSYASAAAPGEALLLIKAPAGVTAVPNARAIFGAWSVLAGRAEICRITFSDQPPPGGQESYALKLGAGCDAKLRNLKLASWRIEGVTLMLYGTDGDSFAFVPSGAGTFAADDAKPPLTLVKR